MKYGEATMGQFEAVINKFGGMEGLNKFLRGELVVEALERTSSIFKTITLGLHKDHKSYRKALEADGYRIGDYAGQILKKIEVSQTPIELDLVVMTVGDLGFPPDGARRDAIYDRAKELGLQLCPAEVGPALRLAYKNQLRGEWLLIAMEPIAGSGGRLLVFLVAHGGSALWLGSFYGRPDFVWSASDRWVFVEPRK